MEFLACSSVALRVQMKAVNPERYSHEHLHHAAGSVAGIPDKQSEPHNEFLLLLTWYEHARTDPDPHKHVKRRAKAHMEREKVWSASVSVACSALRCT